MTTKTREEVFTHLHDTLVDLFEIDAGKITPAANLYSDLDIDSIDAVDLIVQLKPMVGRRLMPEAFKSVRTVQDVVDALYGLVHETPHA